MELRKCIEILSTIGLQIRQKVFENLNSLPEEYKSTVFKEREEDSIYQIDRDVEDLVVSELGKRAQRVGGVVLIAEGIDVNGELPVFPANQKPDEARFRFIIDPIDGTRGLMYNKRPAFFLGAVAINKGEQTRLSDIQAAAMIELPIAKNAFADSFTAIKGEGVEGARTNLFKLKDEPLKCRPSKASSIYGGFAQLSRFFSPGRDIIAKIEEEMIGELFPNVPGGKAFVFEDQYISSGGQFYELLVGHDRFTADIRASLNRSFRKEGKKTGLTCHPYDLCAKLALDEAGVVVTGIDGNPLDCPLDTTTEVDWLAYANKEIQREVEPVLHRILRRFGL